MIHIDYIICPDYIEDKLEAKHSVVMQEVRQVLVAKPRIRFVEKGHVRGEDVYSAFGQTYAGRYLAVFFIHKPDSSTAIIISGRDMTRKERKRYGRK